MTKTLTEQWKKKELKDGDYYLLNKAGDIVCDYYIEILGHFDSVLTENVKEVLAPVPSYDEVKRLQEQLKSANNAMKAMLPFAHNYSKERIEKYLKKWGVK